MKRLSLLILMLVIAAFPSAAQQKKTQPVKEYTIEQFMNTVRIAGSSFSSDEKSILFHTNKTGIYNVYSVPVSGGALAQLTSSTKESTYAVSYFPKDTRFLYRYDRGGNENEHLYLRELDGTERDLTPGDKVKANFLGWSHDRKTFFYSTNERDARFFDIYEMPIDTFKPALIYKDELGLDFSAISNDKKYIAFQKNGASTADSDVFLYNTATKEMKNITAHTGDVANGAETFDVNSKYLYYLTDTGSEFRHVAR
jgi:Tol biopolymer transport system component